SGGAQLRQRRPEPFVGVQDQRPGRGREWERSTFGKRETGNHYGARSGTVAAGARTAATGVGSEAVLAPGTCPHRRDARSDGGSNRQRLSRRADEHFG